MELGAFEILAGIGILSLLLYYYLTSSFDFWKKRNVSGPKPQPLFGNVKDILLGKLHPALWFTKLYNDFKSEDLIGVFMRSKPVLVVKDPDLIKDVLIKDFHVFSDRGMYVSPKATELNQHLVNLEYERWRPLRSHLSPVFTSGKLKEMFYLMADCAHHFEKYLEKIAARGEVVECRELTAKFTTQTIGVCAFGLDTQALSDEDSDFRKFGRAVFAPSFMNITRHLLQENFPMIYELLGPLKLSGAVRFFIRSMKETLEYRKQNKFRKNDFVDLLMDLQKQPEKLGKIGEYCSSKTLSYVLF